MQPNILIVLQNGGPIAVDWAVSSPKVKAILDTFQPGQLGGDAILNLLSGAAVPVTLPLTIPSSVLPACCLH